MALSVIEWLDDSGAEMVHREPEGGSGEFRLGSQLVVMESQAAVFFRDGKALDTFRAGRHTLETANLPLLASLVGMAFGGRSPFRAEVYFVSTKVHTNLKWGTREPVVFRDPELAMVRLRGFGAFSVRVTDPQVFIGNLVGTQGVYGQDQLEDYFRHFIVTQLNETLGKVAKSVFDLPALYVEIASAIKANTTNNFKEYGMEMVDFTIDAITAPEEVQKMMDERTSMAAVGNMQQYTQFKAAKAMEEAAQNPSGAAGAGVGLGAGIGLGAQMAGMMSQATQAAAASPTAAAAPASATVTCPACNTSAAAGAKFCPGCGKPMPEAAFCSGCGEHLPAGAKFCPKCGNKAA